jgi:hypothetical protein
MGLGVRLAYLPPKTLEHLEQRKHMRKNSKSKFKATAKEAPPAPQPTFKQYIGISRDHSGSMSSYGLTTQAKNDYNETIASIKSAAQENQVDTIVNVVRCGDNNSYAGKAVSREVVNSNVQVLRPLTSYAATGYSTPLFDSVGDLIELMENAPDAKDPNVSFLVMAITDGEENSSHNYTASSLAAKIRKLQATDRWTFVFRVPKGSYKQQLVNKLGIYEGNVQEWELTAKGFQTATVQTKSAFSNYYLGRKTGIKGSSTFYVDMSKVSAGQVRSEVPNITSEVKLMPVYKTADIKTFMETTVGYLKLGTAFYQLTKTEKAVQDHKRICIRNKKSGAIYGGMEAREVLGLPMNGSVKLAPGDHAEFDIFIQSTSTNRKLMPNTTVLYWPTVR